MLLRQWEYGLIYQDHIILEQGSHGGHQHAFCETFLTTTKRKHYNSTSQIHAHHNLLSSVGTSKEGQNSRTTRFRQLHWFCTTTDLSFHLRLTWFPLVHWAAQKMLTMPYCSIYNLQIFPRKITSTGK